MRNARRPNRQADAGDGKRPRRGRLQEQATPINFATAAKKNKRGTNAKSLANLQRGTHVPAGGTVAVTPARAECFVKLRAAGMSELAAVCLTLRGEPDEPKTDKQKDAAVRAFLQSTVVSDAYAEFNGGPWQDLDDDTRTEIALRMHTAQCAYLLYTSDLSDPMVPMKKIDYAKTVIMEQLALAKESGDNDKFTLFMQQLVSNANAALPPTFKAKDNGALPALPAEFAGSMKES